MPAEPAAPAATPPAPAEPAATSSAPTAPAEPAAPAATPPAPGKLTRELPAESPESPESSKPPKRVPLVTYLALEPEPHLLVWECSACAARFFDRRNACAACGGAAASAAPTAPTAPTETTGTAGTTAPTETPGNTGTTAPAAGMSPTAPAETRAPASFVRKSVSTTGRLRAFSVVHRASPKIKVPFVAAVVEADDGTMIRSNLLVEPDPEQITFPMRVRLDTYPVGTDSQGSECVAFGFSPLQDSSEEDSQSSRQESTQGSETSESGQSSHQESTQGSETSESGQSSHQESTQGSETSESGQKDTRQVKGGTQKETSETKESSQSKSIPSIPSIPDISTVPQAPQGAA